MPEFIDLAFAPNYISYADAYQKQLEIHAEVVSGKRPNTVLLLEHSSVYTAGKRTEAAEAATGDVVEAGGFCWTIGTSTSGPAFDYTISTIISDCETCRQGKMENWLATCCGNPFITAIFSFPYPSVMPGDVVLSSIDNQCYTIENCTLDGPNNSAAATFRDCFECEMNGGTVCR